MNSEAGAEQNNKDFVEASTAWDNGDLRRAFQLFVRAAESGDSSSQLALGYFHDYGLYVKKDKKKAMQWYYQAYRQGDAGAANNIATVHRDRGQTGKMIWWFRRAIAMGDHDALLNLGKNYESGVGVVKSPMRALNCYRRLLASEYVTEFSWEQATKRLSKLLRNQRRVRHGRAISSHSH
jgi:TPR repeat protein